MRRFVSHGVIWATGIGAIVCGTMLGDLVGASGSTILLTIGGTLLSAAIIGTMLSLSWWEEWTRKAIQKLLHEVGIEGLGLDRRLLRSRLADVLIQAYGTPEREHQYEKLIRNDILERLSMPVRRGFSVQFRLDPYDDERFSMARSTITVAYSLHYTCPESLLHQPLERHVIAGYLDVPDVVLELWNQRLAASGIDDCDSTYAAAILRDLITKEVPLFRFLYLYVNGVPQPTDYVQTDLEISAADEPSVAFRVRCAGKTIESPKLGTEYQVRYAYQLVDNAASYYSLTMRELTDGLTAHLSYDSGAFSSNLRYMLPSHFESSVAYSLQSRPGEVDMVINRILLPGHSLLFSWYPIGVRLSKLSDQSWDSL